MIELPNGIPLPGRLLLFEPFQLVLLPCEFLYKIRELSGLILDLPQLFQVLLLLLDRLVNALLMIPLFLTQVQRYLNKHIFLFLEDILRFLQSKLKLGGILFFL